MIFRTLIIVQIISHVTFVAFFWFYDYLNDQYSCYVTHSYRCTRPKIVPRSWFVMFQLCGQGLLNFHQSLLEGYVKGFRQMSCCAKWVQNTSIANFWRSFRWHTSWSVSSIQSIHCPIATMYFLSIWLPAEFRHMNAIQRLSHISEITLQNVVSIKQQILAQFFCQKTTLTMILKHSICIQNAY